MKKILTIILLLMMVAGMIIPLVKADNESNQTNVTTIPVVNISIPEIIEDKFIDWHISSSTGANLINFENKPELQHSQLNLLSASEHELKVECKPHNEDNDICYYLTFEQNIGVSPSSKIIQASKISLLLPDGDKYSGELFFTDENDYEHMIIVRALPRDEFSFDGTTILFGIAILTSTLAFIISLVICLIIMFSNNFTFWRFILSVLLIFPISFVIYLFLSLL